MSKKDYQAIAAVIYWTKPDPSKHCGADRLHQWTMLLDEMIPILRAGNPRFNAELFREACETGKCKGMRPVAA